MPAGGMDLAVMVLLLMGLMSSGQDCGQDGFAYDAILKANDMTLSVESMTEVLIGPSEERVSKLIAKLGSDDFATREAAYKAVINLGPSAIPQLKAIINSTQDLEVRMRCEQAIKEMAIYKGRYLQLKCAALAGLAKLNAKEKTELVAKYLDDDSDIVRTEAARALAKFGSKKAHAILAKHVKAAVETGKAKTPEILTAYLPHASKKELAKICTLLGTSSHTIDICLLKAYAERMKLEDLVGIVRKYVAITNSTPPKFIRDFLIDVYSLKNDPRYNWLALDETFPWKKFCKTGGTLRKIDDTQLATIRKNFAAGLAGNDRVFMMQECLRAVPGGALFVAGADVAQLHKLGVMQDLTAHIGADPVLNLLLQKTLTHCGPFHTDAAVFYFDPKDLKGRYATGGFILHGKYNSAMQTEAFAAMMGEQWKKCVHNGTTYLRKTRNSYGSECGGICFYGDRYILVGLDSRYAATMETMLDRLNSQMPSILTNKDAMNMLNQQTLSSGAWAIVQPGSIGRALLLKNTSRYQGVDKANPNMEYMAQLALFSIKSCVATVNIQEDTLSLKLIARYADAESAKRIHGYLGKLCAAGIQGLDMGMGHVDQEALPAIAMVQDFLKKAKFKQNGSTIEAKAEMNMVFIREINRVLYLPMFSASMAKELRKVFNEEQRLKAEKRALEAYIKHYSKPVEKLKEQEQALDKEEQKLNAEPDSPEKKTRLDDIKIEKQHLEAGQKAINKDIDKTRSKIDGIDNNLKNLAEPGDAPNENEKKDPSDEFEDFDDKDSESSTKEKKAEVETIVRPAPAQPQLKNSSEGIKEARKVMKAQSKVLELELGTSLEKLFEDRDEKVLVMSNGMEFFKDEKSARKKYPDLDKMHKITTKNGFIIYIQVSEDTESKEAPSKETPSKTPDVKPAPAKPEG